MTSMRQSIDIETNDPARRRSLVFALAWPSIGENFLSSCVSMADTIMVSAIGTHAVSAVGLVTQPRFIVFSAFMALGIGTTALVARAKGEGDQRKANTVMWQSLLLATIIVAILCVTLYFLNEPLIRMIAGGEIAEGTVQMGVDYFRIQIYGFPLLGLTFIMNAALRGAGNTRAAFYSNAASNAVNVFFNYCLIGGNLGFPAMGVEGASIATVIGQGVAFCMCLFLLLQKKQYVFLDRHITLRLDRAVCGRISNIGMPALLEQVIMRVGMLLFTMIVTSLGDSSYATHIIAMNIQQFSFITGMSFGTAATTLTGQCLGRGVPDLARAYVKTTQRIGYVFSLVVAVLLFCFGGVLASMFTDDAAIILLASQVLKIVAISNPISNARFVYNSALRGAGDSRFTAVITFIGILLCRPLISLFLVNVFHLGLIGVWIALISDAVLCYILARWRWQTGKWATIRV